MANMCAKVTSTYMEFTLAFGPKPEFSFSFKYNRLFSISKVAMLILYEHMFFLSNIMFIFFVCFSCFFICHPLLLWQKNKPEQNGIPIPFCSGLSRIADSSCPSDYPSLFNYYFSTTLFNNDAFTVFSVKCCNHFFHGVDIKSVASTFYRKGGLSVYPNFVPYSYIIRSRP